MGFTSNEYSKRFITVLEQDECFDKIFTPVDGEFDPDELERGIEVEMEHTANRKAAEIIAKQHLMEDPKYYTKLASIHTDNEEDENTVGDGVLGPEAAVGHVDPNAGDWYAPGDYRIPKVLGAIQTRMGSISPKKKKKKKKSKKK